METDRGLIGRAEAPAIIAECRRLREWRSGSIVLAAVDQETIGSSLRVPGCGGSGWGIGRGLRGIGRRIDTGPLETVLGAGGRSRRASGLPFLGRGRLLAADRLRGLRNARRRRSRLAGGGLAGSIGGRGGSCSRGRGGGSRRLGSRGGRLNLIERQQLQLPLRGGRIGRYTHVLLVRGKAEHLNLHRPDSLRQVGKGIGALLVGDGHEFLVALARRYGSARDGQAAELNLSVMFRGGQAEYRQTGQDTVPEIVGNSL